MSKLDCTGTGPVVSARRCFSGHVYCKGGLIAKPVIQVTALRQYYAAAIASLQWLFAPCIPVSMRKGRCVTRTKRRAEGPPTSNRGLLSSRKLRNRAQEVLSECLQMSCLYAISFPHGLELNSHFLRRLIANWTRFIGVRRYL